MEATVIISQVDCSNYQVFVNRRHSICGMVGEAEIGLDPTWNQAFVPYGDVVIFEEGTKVFTGFVANISHSRMPPARVINCQCPLKKVRDYWYTSFSTAAGDQVPTLIGNIMTTVGVSYSINDSYTYPTAEEEWMNTSAMEIFRALLTMAGWQAYSDPDGVIQIGRLSRVETPDHTFTNLIEIESAEDDSWARNAIAVYGAPGVHVKRYTTDYVAGDFERAGAFANPQIGSRAAAIDVATKALKLFSSDLHVVHAKMVGDPDVRIGQTASVTNTFVGLDGHDDVISTVRSSMSENGYILDVTLGERCPTIWGFGGMDYLYAATGGSGVYRSVDYGDTFVAANGLGGTTLTGDALYVNAIEVDHTYNETVWAATRGGLYRTTDAGRTAWSYMDPGELPLYTGGSMSSGSAVWYDADQDEINSGRLYFIGVDHDSQESWIVRYTGGSWLHWNCRWADI